GQMTKPASSVRRCAGTKQKIGRAGGDDRAARRCAQRRMSGLRRSNKADGSGAVMSEREADLAIVVAPCRSLRTGCPRDGRESGCALRRDRQRVTVLGEQRRLEKDCKDTEQRGTASRSRPPGLVGPEPYRTAEVHVSPIPPATSGQRYTVTLFSA